MYFLKKKNTYFEDIFLWLVKFDLDQFLLKLAFAVISMIFLFRWSIKPRGVSRTSARSKMELFAIIVNALKPLTIITKSPILDVAAVLDPLLKPQSP